MKFGFELEAFYLNDMGRVTLPPTGYPVDGFPGLVEIRTVGGQGLDEAYFEVLRMVGPKIDRLWFASGYTFTPEERRELRKREWRKEPWDIQNIYGKKPRALRDKTIASFQVNVSHEEAAAYTDKNGVYHRPIYGLLDVPRIVRALDKEFKHEIATSGRQQGEYCIKNNVRLEYRSLPNTVFKTDIVEIQTLLKRLHSAIEG